MTTKKTRDFLIRSLPVELADKVKIAAALHSQSMQGYVQEILSEHVQALEKKGVTLSLPKGKG
jgi:plasmid stability protein